LEWACSAWLSAVGGRWQLRKAALANQVMVSYTWFFPQASLEESFMWYIPPYEMCVFPHMNMDIAELCTEFLRRETGVAC
jgi:hypothetical protein